MLGLAAGALQIGFYALTYPTFDDPVWGWTGTVNAVLAVGQFFALVPVAYALRSRLPAARPVTIATALVVVAMAIVPGLRLVLIAGWLPAQVAVWMLMGFLVVPLYGWLLLVNSIAHRHAALPPAVTRLGLFVGLSGPAGLLLLIAGLLVGTGLGGQLDLGGPGALLLIPGAALGTAGWLLLPVWTLLLGALVFGRRALESSARATGSDQRPGARTDVGELR